MFPPELIALIEHLVTSKEVIGVTVFLVMYFSLVFYVAKTHHRKRMSGFSSSQKKLKKEKNISSAPAISESDDLGIEEE
jgi:hypothetical protein